MSLPSTLWRNGRITGKRPADALVTNGERLLWVGEEASLPRELRAGCAAVHDFGGRLVTPGFIDCHTHLVFGGQRAEEFAAKLAGEDYESIARRGGGILSTVRATRASDDSALLAAAWPRLAALRAEGVTTLEIKSGYGLSFEDERRMLRVARRIGELGQVDVRTSFLGAHAVPPEFAGRADAYLDAVCDEWLPALAQEGLVDAVDVYCDRNAFSARQSARVFEAARAQGLPVKMHAAQFDEVGGIDVAAKYGALSCDHLEALTPAGARVLGSAGIVAVLLPVAYYVLAQSKPPPVAALREAGVPIAVSTDCNPGTSPCASLLLAMHMACRLFGLRVEEALEGVTTHAARALGLQGDRGRLEAGLRADFVSWNVSSIAELVYWIGLSPCHEVVYRGRTRQVAG